MKTLQKLICYILIIVLGCGAILAAFPELAVQTEASAVTGYYKATSVLNLRRGSSSSSQLVYTDSTNSVAVQIPIGTHLLATEISNGYGRVCYKGIYGWVSLSYCEYIRGFVSPTESTSAVIDISSFQKPANFNWTKIKNAGITGVIIRLGGRYAKSDGSGTIYQDDSFLAHYNAAKAVGMNVGFYFFSYAMTREGAVEEAEYCLNLIKQNNLKAELPIFFDLEDYDDDSDKPHYNGGKALNNMLVDSFCSTIENAGYYAGVYTNLNFITNVVDASVLNNRAFWYAQYNSEVSYQGRYDLWQYTSTGTVDGYSIQSALDMNYCYRDYPTFIKQYGFNGFEGNHSTGSDGHEHIFATPVVTQAATCTSDGLQSVYCATCSELLETDVIFKTNHIITEVFVPNNKINFRLNETFSLQPSQYFDLSSDSSSLSAFNAIQSTGGTLLSYCTYCKQIQSVRYFEDIAGCTHRFNIQPAIYQANSTMNIRTGPATSFSAITNTSGTTIYVAAGETYEVFYKLGEWAYSKYNDITGWVKTSYSTCISHDVYYNTTTITRSGCDTDGLQSASCQICGESAYIGTISAEGHIAGQAVKIDGTCLTNGNYTTHCQACNKLLKFEISDFGKHIYTRTVHTYPTDYSLGTATYTCNICDESRSVRLRSLNMYDAVGSTGCDAGDARMALRCSVGLEEITYRYLHRLDVDYDDKLTASDARLLLRISVGLEDEYELLFRYFEIK